MSGILIALAAILIAVAAWGMLTRRWSAEARRSVREQASAAHVRPIMRIPVPWVFILVYLIGVAAQLLSPIVVRSPPAQSVTRVAGLGFVVVGVLLAFTALGIFKRKDTTTIPFETPSALVTSGPYRFSRNPMYLGLTSIYIGVAGTRLEVWPLIVLPLLLAYINFEVIPVEERRLRAVFGQAYADYATRVHRWL
jgi:protein-S-isoprenylcysteine O-methyltransferase Ste14